MNRLLKSNSVTGWLLASPLVLVLAMFLILPVTELDFSRRFMALPLLTGGGRWVGPRCAFGKIRRR